MTKLRGEYYPMEYDAWDEGTHDLSLEEEGAYLRLCHQIYRRHGPVLNSERLLCSLWRCHPNKAKALLKRLIEMGKIQITEDGHLTNTRATRELDARETLSTRRSHAGYTGGIRSGESRRKHLKTQESGEAVASIMRTIGDENIEEKKNGEVAASAAILDFGNPSLTPQPSNLEKQYYDRAREVLGKSGAGLAAKLLKAKGQIPLARSALELAATKTDPREYVGACIRGNDPGGAQRGMDPRL